MKTLLLILILASINSFAGSNEFLNDNGGKDDKKKTEKKEEQNKNFHSVRKWKVTIEYENGDKLSKTISVNENSQMSALDMAFSEAEKYANELKNVKGYSVKPVSGNEYILLASNK